MMVHVGLVNVIAGLFIVSLSSVGFGCCIAGLWMLREPKKSKKPKRKYETSDYRRNETERREQHGETR